MRSLDYLLLLMLLETSTIQKGYGEDISESLTVPEVSDEFHCTEEGDFSILGSCTDFYQCQQLADGTFSSEVTIGTCPTGMIFNGNSQQCLLWPLVSNHTECLSETTVVASAPNCSHELTEEITMDAAETCQYMLDISKYVTQVVSTPLLRPSIKHNEEFNKIITDYNEVLTRAKANIKVWRHGDDIPNDVESLFMKVMQFGRELERKYEINLERRKSSYIAGQERDDETIAKIQEDIKVMEKKIKDIQEVINETSVLGVKKFLESTLERTRKEIEEKKNLINQTSPIGRELEEIVAFLGFVRNDADVVWKKAKLLEQRLELLYKTLLSDTVEFEIVSKLTNESIARVIESDDNMQFKVINYKDALENLETKKKEREAMLSFMNDAGDSKSSEIRALVREIQRKEDDFRVKRNQICPSQTMIISLFNFSLRSTKNLSACIDLQTKFNSSITEDLNKLEVLNSEFSRINQERFHIINQIQNILKNMTQLHGQPTNNDQIFNLESEMQELEAVLSDLQDLNNLANSSSTSVHKATKKIKKVYDIFHTISDNLTEMVDRVNSASNNMQQMVIREESDSVMLFLMCQVEDLHAQGPILAKCYNEL